MGIESAKFEGDGQQCWRVNKGAREYKSRNWVKKLEGAE